MQHEAKREQKRNVIIAIPKPSFADGLKKHFENEGLIVSGVYVVLDHLVESLHSLKEQSDFKLDGLVISSSIATKGKEKRLEFLADVIEKIRNDFSETSIIFLSDEIQGHPLLAELVSMGVYNIFAKSAQTTEPLNIKQLISCIDQPMLYNEVKKFREFNKDIPWRKFVNGGRTITINVESKTEQVQKTSSSESINAIQTTKEEIIERQDSSRDDDSNIKHEGVPPTEPEPSKSNLKPEMSNESLTNFLEEDLEEEEFLWILPPVKPKVIVRDRIIGKQIIAVAGIEKGVGTTHTAILIANHLAYQGYQVKLIECSGNDEFIYIEKAYEGKNVDVTQSEEFNINGVTFIKTGEDIDMASHLTSEHTHIVLDLGMYESSRYIEEFHRASVQLLVGPGSEWKQHTLNYFISSNRDVDQSRWKILIPLVDKQTINDIKGDVGEELTILEIPFHPDPFKAQEDTGENLDDLFEDERTKKRKFTVIGLSILVFIVTAVVAAGVSLYFIL